MRNNFIIIAISIFLTGFIIQGTYGIFAAYLSDVGLSSAKVATVFSIFSIVLTIAKIFMGALYDRFGLRVTLYFGYICSILALMLILLTASVPGLAIACAVALAMATPLETIGITLIVRGVFGTEHYNDIIGKMMAMNYAGYAVGAPVINLFFDISGSYNMAFIIYACIMLVLLFATQYVAIRSHKMHQ